MPIFKPRVDSVEDIRARCLKEHRIYGEHLNVFWEIVLGCCEKHGKDLTTTNSGRCRFNSGNSLIVGIWKDEEALRVYEERMQQNAKFLMEEMPKAEAEWRRLTEVCRSTPQSLANFPDPRQKIVGHLPYSPAILQASCMCSFQLELTRIHDIIEEALPKFSQGKLPKIHSIAYWEISTSGFQPAARLVFEAIK